MATACAVYKGSIRLGTGTVADGSATISSWSAAAGVGSMARRNVMVTLTGAGNHVGRSFRTRITADNTTTLTMQDKCPHVGA